MVNLRLDELIAVVSEIVGESAKSIDQKTYNDLVECLNLRHPNTIGEKLITNLVTSVHKQLEAEFNTNHAQLVQRIKDLDKNIANAYVLQEKAQSGVKLRPEEQPCALHKLTTEDLVNCQLRPARQQWIADLDERLVQAEEQINALRTECNNKREEVRALASAVGVRITALDEIQKQMSDPDEQSQ